MLIKKGCTQPSIPTGSLCFKQRGQNAHLTVVSLSIGDFDSVIIISTNFRYGDIFDSQIYQTCKQVSIQ